MGSGRVGGRRDHSPMAYQQDMDRGKGTFLMKIENVAVAMGVFMDILLFHDLVNRSDLVTVKSRFFILLIDTCLCHPLLEDRQKFLVLAPEEQEDFPNHL